MKPSQLTAPPASPTVREMLSEVTTLIEVVPVAGPPAVFILVPWLLLGLMLAGPFTLILTLVVAMAAAAALVGLVLAAVASPFFLLRHLRSRHQARRGARLSERRLSHSPRGWRRPTASSPQAATPAG